MGKLLTLAYLFFIGSIIGWFMELLYRNWMSSEKKWVNPGFCTGPYLPIYGVGLCVLYILASLESRNIIANPFWNKFALFITMAICMTLIEYIAGIFCLKRLKVRLWDYSDRWGNIHGVICPLFSVAWAILGAIYYFLIHPHMLDALLWLSENLAFSFFIGMFFGIFFIDVAHSANIVFKLKRFADENKLILQFEAIKDDIRNAHQQSRRKYHFFSPFQTMPSLTEHLREMYHIREREKNETEE